MTKTHMRACTAKLARQKGTQQLGCGPVAECVLCMPQVHPSTAGTAEERKPVEGCIP